MRETAVVNKSGIRVMLADDHPIVCLGLATMIDSQPDMTVVAQAGNGREAVEMFELNTPDVTLMDLRMPDKTGSKRFGRSAPNTPLR